MREREKYILAFVAIIVVIVAVGFYFYAGIAKVPGKSPDNGMGHGLAALYFAANILVAFLASFTLLCYALLVRKSIRGWFVLIGVVPFLALVAIVCSLLLG